MKTWLFSLNPVEISEEAFLFNIGNQLSPVQNYILLETKFYIFYTKHLETPLSITHLKNKLKRTFKILESLAIKNNIIENFKIEWNPYSNILSQWSIWIMTPPYFIKSYPWWLTDSVVDL